MDDPRHASEPEPGHAAEALAAAPGEPVAARVDSGDELTDLAYFWAIEDSFNRLRGAAVLLSAADYQVARRWHRQAIPLDLVRQALDEVFARRRERGAKGRISTLRYCAPAVEAAWVERAELAAPGARAEAEAFDTAPRLVALAAALPAGFDGVAELRARLLALSRSRLDAPAIEERLAQLDHEALDGALAGLSEAERAALDSTVAKAVAALGGGRLPRLPAAEIERARERLARQVLRGRLGMPILSLFSPEALEPEPDEPPGSNGTEP
jgi:hypothetical protein